MITSNIWKDTYYTSSADTLTYYITDGVDTIFSGKAYRFPDGNDLKIKVNDICSSHLNSLLPSTVFVSNPPASTTLTDSVKDFYLYNSANTLLETFRFYNNWNTGDNSTSGVKSVLVNGRKASGMYQLYTTISNNKYVVSCTTGTSSYYPNTGCGEYAIYYNNLKGGWDSYLIEGKVVEGKAMTHYEYSKNVDNTSISRENNRFQTNIKPNWVINTSWVTDTESKIIYDNLLTSNDIYLHNLITGRIYPVHIVDTQVTRKTFLNEMMLINYEINLESDNIEIRQ